jgi:GntR family negative regulator for fad regulon and positive regulator of fabA
MVIKAQSPAGFAEEYIIESIWNNRFHLALFCPLNVNSPNLLG